MKTIKPSLRRPSKTNENMLIIQVGKKFCGKTEFCKQYLAKAKPKRGLILDIDNEYTDYPYLGIDSFIENRKPEGIYRINFKGQTLKEMEKMYIDAILFFRQGTLICENPFKIMEKLPIDMIGVLCTGKHKNVNAILNINSLKPLFDTKYLLNNTRYLYFYKTIDKVECYKRYKKIDSKYYNLLLEAEKLLQKQKLVIIDLEKMTLK